MPTKASSDPKPKDEESQKPKKDEQESDDDDDDEKEEEEENNTQNDDDAESDSDSDSSDSDSSGSDSSGSGDDEPPLTYVRPGDEAPRAGAGADMDENSPEANVRLFEQVLNSKRARRERNEEDREYVFHEDLFDFPEDPENWQEEDLRELWADAPLEMTKPGWDPKWADDEDWEIVRKEIAEGRDPPIQPFYVPFRRPYPVIPDNHHDIANAKAVIEELDRTEEFLTWVSYVFPDGSTFEGTVWDDLAHGKGVYVAEMGLVRYEGEWLRNEFEGHGVIEVDIPDIEPIPGSKHEEQMRAQGHIISRDYMEPEDKRWLEMDMEDSLLLAGDQYEIPFYETEEWISLFGSEPEKGRYRYAGQWKHGRMHGCGLYEINERMIFGRFYFGELLEEPYGCDDEIAAMHAGIAEVAAAKARMFVNKPDGMVREERGPYNDPQHPYFYEEEDVWMAPGFINQFYEVPDYWKVYVHEVDKEREMWLNSFYRAPLRLPMPAELEYWWAHDDEPEFVLLNNGPELDPDDPSQAEQNFNPIILHTPTGRLINYIEDEEYGVRLFWQPEDGKVDPEKIEYLPLGFDDFYGRETDEKKENFFMRFLAWVDKVCEPYIDKLTKWAKEQKEERELNLEILKKELELWEAEQCLEQLIEDIDEDLKRKEKEAQKKADMGLEEEKEDTPPEASGEAKQAGEAVAERDKEEEGEEEENGDDDEEDDAPSSFGSANTDQNTNKNGQEGSKPRPSPFSASSLSFATSSLVSGIPSLLQQSFSSWRKGRSTAKATLPTCPERPADLPQKADSVSFPTLLGTRGSLISKSQSLKLRADNHSNGKARCLRCISQIPSQPSATVKPKRNQKHEKSRSLAWLHGAPESELDSILSLHTPIDYLEQFKQTKMW